MNWFAIHNIEINDSPALVIYKECIQQNIRFLKSMVPAMIKAPDVLSS